MGEGLNHSSPSHYNSDDKNTQFCATASNAGKENRADESGEDERHRLDGANGVILCDLNVKGSCRCLAGHSASVATPAHSPSRITSKPISCFTPSAALMRPCMRAHVQMGRPALMKINKLLPCDVSCLFRPLDRRMVAPSSLPYAHSADCPSARCHTSHHLREYTCSKFISVDPPTTTTITPATSQ